MTTPAAAPAGTVPNPPALPPLTELVGNPQRLAAALARILPGDNERLEVAAFNSSI